MVGNYKGKKIIVIGLGLTGLSCVNFFLARNIIPYVMDTRTNPPNIDKLSKSIEYHLGNLNNNLLLSADIIVVSPSISLSHPSLKMASKAGVEIISDIELFCREVQAPIIAITGSNGKSTVTALVGEMIKAANINVGIGGNIGIPALNLLDLKYEMYVLELSSFQLETTFSLCATVATILNVTKDHMDRYSFGDMKQYLAAKLRIYNNAETYVVNADDSLTIPVHNMNRYCVSFGVDTGNYHLDCQRGQDTWLCVNNEKILNTKEMSIYGRHNYTNALAALAIADIVNLPRESSLEVLTNFTTLEHCLQLVLERNDIRWINDSKSTNVSSTKVALDSLHVKGTLHLLLGGYGKSANFSSLKSYLINNKVQLYCFGQERNKLADLYSEISERTETLEQAMYLLAPRVKPGDVVLLSPACASFDQFKNFKQRGSLFVRLAKKLSR